MNVNTQQAALFPRCWSILFELEVNIFGIITRRFPPEFFTPSNRTGGSAFETDSIESLKGPERPDNICDTVDFK